MIMELKVGYDEDTIEAANHYEKVWWESFVGYNHIPNDPSKEALLDHQFVMSILEGVKESLSGVMWQKAAKEAWGVMSWQLRSEKLAI